MNDNTIPILLFVACSILAMVAIASLDVLPKDVIVFVLVFVVGVPLSVMAVWRLASRNNPYW